MLRQIDMVGPVYNATDDYYIAKGPGTLVLFSSNENCLTFFNPNDFKTYQCTTDEFQALAAKKKLVKADYVLGYSYIPKGDVDITREFIASNNLKELYKSLVNIAADPSHCNTVFQACYVKDLNTKKYLVHGNEINKLHLELKMELYENQKFQPSSVNIERLLEAAGIRYPKSEEANQTFKTKR